MECEDDNMYNEVKRLPNKKKENVLNSTSGSNNHVTQMLKDLLTFTYNTHNHLSGLVSRLSITKITISD